MPNPGVQSQFIAKSGGNQFQGEYHLDWYNNSLQGIEPARRLSRADGVQGTNAAAIREHSNEIDRLLRSRHQRRRPDQEGQGLVSSAPTAQQYNAVAQPNFQFDKTFDTKLWNAVGKGTYQMNQKNKLIGYYQWGQKMQPNRLPFATYTYTSPEQTYKQNSGSWVYKGEWNSTVSDKLYLEARYGDFGYYFPLVTNSPDNFFWHDTGALDLGRRAPEAAARSRSQAVQPAPRPTSSTPARAATPSRWAASCCRRSRGKATSRAAAAPSNIEQIYNNGVSSQVIFGIPDGDCSVGSLSAHDCLTVEGGARCRSALFVNDTWAVGQLDDQRSASATTAITAGCRSRKCSGATVGPVTGGGRNTQPKRDLYTWNLLAPRLGYVYDLSGNGKTVIKANYGLYWHNPGVGISQNANPNIASKSATYTWNDQATCAGCINGDKRWQPGEESALPTAPGAVGRRSSSTPDIKAPYSHEASVWVERQTQPDDGRPCRLRLQDAGRSDHDQLSARSRPERLHRAVGLPGPRLERCP